MHIQNGVDPANDRVGYAPIRSCSRELAVINASIGYLGGILKNSGATNIVISPDKDSGFISPEDADIIRDTINSRISGEEAGSAFVFMSPVNVSSLSAQPKDMLLGDIDAAQVAKVCAAFGTNPMVLGLPDPQKTYSNYREGVRAGWNGSIIPVLDAIADAMNETDGICAAFDPNGRLRFGWDYDGIEELSEDRQVLTTVAATWWEKGIGTRNESRNLLGLPPVPGGDIFVDELGQQSEPDPADSDPSADPQAEDDAADTEESGMETAGDGETAAD
jgi:phage portal protein BeeE